MHHQITVIGPIASGKTTASQFLAKNLCTSSTLAPEKCIQTRSSLGCPLLDADLYETNPFLPGYIEDNSRWSFATELFFTLARIKKLKAVKEMLTKSSIIVDSGLIMSHQVYTKNHLVQGTMTASEWEFFTNIVEDYKSTLPDPDLVIYLTCSPKVQLQRIKVRGRSFESGYTLEYLQSITDRLSEFAESLANIPSTTLIIFDSEKNDVTKKSGQTALLSLLTPYLK